MQGKTYSILNGSLVLASRAAIPIADRGFRFGDGVFETIRIYHGVPYQWELHLARLMGGLTALRIPDPGEDWAKHAKKLLKKNGVKEGFLRIGISRGVGSRGYEPYPKRMPASWAMETLTALPPPEHPYTLWLSQLPRLPRQCLPVNFKLAQGVNSTLALMEAKDNDADEAIQLTIDGYVCEAASANIFWIRKGDLYTPALDTGCLNGTTREALLRLSPQPVRLAKQGITAMEDAEAIFLTNTRLGVWPVASLQPAGSLYDVKHPTIRKLAKLLAQDMADYTTKHRVRWVGRK